jgi:adenylylsulfate kinase-like enzyme
VRVLPARNSGCKASIFRLKRGLYQTARKGEIKGFTGIDSPYEEPAHPDLILETGKEKVEDSVAVLLKHVLGLVQLKDLDHEGGAGPGGQI